MSESENWRTASLRLAIFCPDLKLPPEKREWWAEAVGRPPAETHRRIGARRDVGEISTDSQVLLVLETDLRNIQWTFTPNLVAHPSLTPSIGQFKETAQLLEEVLGDWLARLEVPVSRIAVGAQLFQPADSEGDALRILTTYLPHGSVPAGNPIDFMYRFNRRTEIRAEETIAVNRLRTWSTGTMQVSLGDGNPFDRSIAMLELDINTAPFKRIGSDADFCRSVVAQLVAFGEDIVESGVRA